MSDYMTNKNNALFYLVTDEKHADTGRYNTHVSNLPFFFFYSVALDLITWPSFHVRVPLEQPFYLYLHTNTCSQSHAFIKAAVSVHLYCIIIIFAIQF